jgi:hypothetical protein
VIAPDAYCREIEAYLCRRNDGHLIRITGPAFGQVCEWARQGVPLTVAFTGIDRYFERYYRKGPRRRPVRIEFCEADVLEAFDDWRRATGVPSVAPNAAGADVSGDEAAHRRKGATLAAHVARVLVRITLARGSQTADARMQEALADASRVLDAVQAEAPGARGARREALLARLRELDASLLTVAREGLDGPALQALAREADAELEPFRQRMPAAALAAARQAALDGLIRRQAGLPVAAFE